VNSRQHSIDNHRAWAAKKSRQDLEFSQRVDRLCELNVVELVTRLCQTWIVQNAWECSQSLQIHGRIAVRAGYVPALSGLLEAQ